MKYLFLLKRIDQIDFEETRAMVVCAEGVVEAMKYEPPDGPDADFNVYWTPNNLCVQIIGVANDDLPLGVVLEDNTGS